MDEIIEDIKWYNVKGYRKPSEWDWKDIRKEWKALKMPKDVAYDPFHIPWGRCGYYMLISKRGVGKTTSVVLLGMILFKLYGVVAQYIRQTEDMTAPKFAQDLMDTIMSCGYIEKLTNGRWNYAYYHAKRWVYANLDPDGKISEKSDIPFMEVMSVDKCITAHQHMNAYKKQPEVVHLRLMRGDSVLDEWRRDDG